MKFYPERSEVKLPNDIADILIKIRHERQFCAKSYIKAKTSLINKYFEQGKLDTAIIAVSGGIDSAVALRLITLAKETKNSPIKKIIPITLPAENCIGVTNQNDSKEKAKLLKAKAINIENLVKQLEEIINNFNESQMGAWAQGQLIPYLRTSLLYSLSAAVADLGNRAIIIGTTNRDEGSYLGYIGKASDALTDLQIISDIHKSEVYKVAKEVGVPEEIIKKIPTGDMFDNRTDEEVFGAPYDFVELYTSLLKKYQTEYLELSNTPEYINLYDESKTVFKYLSNNLTKLHNYNRHKYISCSSSIHLDITNFYFPGGWRNNSSWNKDKPYEINFKKIVNLVEIEPALSEQNNCVISKISHNIYKVENLLSKEESQEILEQLDLKDEWIRANQYGKANENSKVGSFRKSWYSQAFSEKLKERLIHIPFNTYIPEKDIQDDEGESCVWTFSNISSLHRFIKYNKGDSLVPHYDESFRVSDYSKTLFSLVVYLTDGETQFFNETRVNHKYSDFDKLSSELTMEPKIIAKCKPGDALIFQHRLLHDSPIIENHKTIIRTDLIFNKPNLGGAVDGY